MLIIFIKRSPFTTKLPSPWSLDKYLRKMRRSIRLLYNLKDMQIHNLALQKV